MLLNSGLSGSGGCIFPDRSLFANWFCETPAQVYESVEYGKIPPVVGAQPPGPPSTTNATADQILQDLARQSQERTAAANAAAYDAALTSGTYTPEGKLPMTATEWEAFSLKYGKWILIALLGAGVLVLFRR